jgi:hypothetical protein
MQIKWKLRRRDHRGGDGWARRSRSSDLMMRKSRSMLARFLQLATTEAGSGVSVWTLARST